MALKVAGRTTTVPKDAWFVAILLLLQRIEDHRIEDHVDGLVLRKLANRCGLRTTVVPSQLGAAVRDLREVGIVAVDSERNRTFSIRLARRLSDDCVKKLEEFNEWATKTIKGVECRKPSGGLPEIEFVSDED